MAKRGTKTYRKALSFACRKWDIDKGEPKESGNSIDDVIKYVRREMYRAALANNKDNEDAEVDMDQESEFLEEINDIFDKDVVVRSVEATTTKEAVPPVDNYVPEEDEDIDVPDQYMFPSSMTFVLWGPFVKPEKG